MLDTNCRKAARLILTGAAVFAVLVFLLPPSRGRTLSALVEPSATLVVVSIWWLGNGSLAARTRAVGVGLAAAALLLLAFTTSYPATIISILWGFPACMCLTAAVFCLWSGRAWSRPRLLRRRGASLSLSGLGLAL